MNQEDIRLPRNRKDLFIKLIKKNPSMIINLSLMMVIFSLPLIFTYGLLYTSLITLPEGSNLNDATNLIFFFGLFSILGFIIFYIGQGALYYVNKKIVWNEPYVYKKHFMKGIKEQFKTSALIGSLTGIIVNTTLWGSLVLLSFAFSNEIIFFIALGSLLVVLLLTLIISQFILSQSVVYELSFISLFKNSLILTILKIGKSLLVFLLTYLLIIGFMIINTITFMIGLVLYVLLNELIVLTWTLFTHQVFDDYINKENYPTYVNKGLASFKDNEDN